MMLKSHVFCRLCSVVFIMPFKRRPAPHFHQLVRVPPISRWVQYQRVRRRLADRAALERADRAALRIWKARFTTEEMIIREQAMDDFFFLAATTGCAVLDLP